MKTEIHESISAEFGPGKMEIDCWLPERLYFEVYDEVHSSACISLNLSGAKELAAALISFLKNHPAILAEMDEVTK